MNWFEIDTKMTYEAYKNANKIDILSFIDLLNEDESEEDSDEN